MDIFAWVSGDDAASRATPRHIKEARSHPGIYNSKGGKSKPSGPFIGGGPNSIPSASIEKPAFTGSNFGFTPAGAVPTPMKQHPYLASEKRHMPVDHQGYKEWRGSTPSADGYHQFAMHPMSPARSYELGSVDLLSSMPDSPEATKVNPGSPESLSTLEPSDDEPPSSSDEKCPRSVDSKTASPEPPDSPDSATLLAPYPLLLDFELRDAKPSQQPEPLPSFEKKGFSSLVGPSIPEDRVVLKARERVRLARGLNDCLDGELRDLEDEMAELTRDLMAVKDQLHRDA